MGGVDRLFWGWETVVCVKKKRIRKRKEWGGGARLEGELWRCVCTELKMKFTIPTSEYNIHAS